MNLKKYKKKLALVSPKNYINHLVGDAVVRAWD